jgi:hypothetical protein
MVFGKALLLLATFGAAPAGATTLLGSTVTATLRYPNFATIYATAPAKTVGAGIELPATDFGYSWLPFYIDINDTQIIFESYWTVGYATSSFDGFLLSFTDASPISQVALDPASTLTLPSFGFSSTSIWFNVSGLVAPSGSRAILTVTSTPAVPEPATWAMMIGGFALAGAAMRRRVPTAVANA